MLIASKHNHIVF